MDSERTVSGEPTIHLRPRRKATPGAAQRQRTPPHGAISVVGRDAIVSHLLDQLVRGSARWITLCGPPGVGKTRLAHVLARRATGQDAPFALVSRLSVRFDEGQDDEPAKRPLLVLDAGRERLHGGAIEAWLSCHPRGAVVACRRTPLGGADERVVQLRPPPARRPAPGRTDDLARDVLPAAAEPSELRDSVRFARAATLARRGDGMLAEAELRGIAARAAANGWHGLNQQSRLLVAAMALHAHRPDEALAAARHAERLATTRGEPALRARAAAIRAAAHVARGDMNAAYGAFVLAEAHAADPITIGTLHAIRGSCELEAGMPRPALASFERAGQVWAGPQLEHHRTRARVGRALALLALGAPRAASAELQRAARTHRRLGCQRDHALTLAAWAAATAAHRDPDLACDRAPAIRRLLADEPVVALAAEAYLSHLELARARAAIRDHRIEIAQDLLVGVVRRLVDIPRYRIGDRRAVELSQDVRIAELLLRAATARCYRLLRARAAGPVAERSYRVVRVRRRIATRASPSSASAVPG